MVHFYNGGKTEDYTSLVDNEILPKTEENESQVTDLNLDFKNEAKASEKKRCLDNTWLSKIVKPLFLLSLVTTIAGLSYRAYTQDSKIQSLEAKFLGSVYKDKAIECRFHISDGQFHRVRGRLTRERTREFKGLTGNACLTACLNVREFDSQINGITISVDSKKRDCWCVRNVTTVTTRYKSCVFKSNETKHNITVDSSKYKCDFQRGDGSGGTEVKVGLQKGKDCINACLYLKQFDNTVNGVNTYLDSRKGGCWCERGMTSVGWSSTFQTCTLLPKDIHTQDHVDPAVCSFRTGHPTTPYHLSRFLITVKQTAPQCVEDCLHMKRVEPSVNGVTVKTDDGRCWCIKDMKNITTMYKTCFLKADSASCLMKNVSFTGGTLKMASNVTTWMDCSDLCQEEEKCSYWTWNAATQRCTLENKEAKKLSVPNHTSGKRTCGNNICDFVGSVRPGAYKTYRKMGEETGKACAMKCLDLQSTEPSVNGATVYLDTNRKGCFCNYNMTIIDQSYKTCFLSPPKTETTFNVNDLNVTCDLVSGDGFGGSEVFLSHLDGKTCLKACLYLTKIDPSVNGITVYANASRPGCWCEKRMGDVKPTPTFKACKFKYKDDVSVDVTSYCQFSDGESDGSGTYVGRLGQEECAKTCSHVTHLDSSLSGITWDRISNSCYCKRNITRIGKFKTCLLKDVPLLK